MRYGRRPRAGTSTNRGERVGALDKLTDRDCPPYKDARRPCGRAYALNRSWPSGIQAPLSWIATMPWIRAKSVGGWMGGDDYLRAGACR